MSRRKTDEETARAAQADDLEWVVQQWLYSLAENKPALAVQRLVDELRAVGIRSQADLAAAPIPLVAAAIRAAWQTDAHSLTGLAAHWRGQQMKKE